MFDEALSRRVSEITLRTDAGAFDALLGFKVKPMVAPHIEHGNYGPFHASDFAASGLLFMGWDIVRDYAAPMLSYTLAGKEKRNQWSSLEDALTLPADITEIPRISLSALIRFRATLAWRFDEAYDWLNKGNERRTINDFGLISFCQWLIPQIPVSKDIERYEAQQKAIVDFIAPIMSESAKYARFLARYGFVERHCMDLLLLDNPMGLVKVQLDQWRGDLWDVMERYA